MDNQFFFSRALGLMAFSMRLLSISNMLILSASRTSSSSRLFRTIRTLGLKLTETDECCVWLF